MHACSIDYRSIIYKYSKRLAQFHHDLSPCMHGGYADTPGNGRPT